VEQDQSRRMRSMFVQVPMMSGPSAVAHIEVSVPLVPQLLDQGKYYMTPKPPADDTERRRRAARGPILRSLVKLAVRCDSAEQLGLALKRRYDRQRQRQGIASPGPGGASGRKCRLASNSK
jgi:hypothetical protein